VEIAIHTAWDNQVGRCEMKKPVILALIAVAVAMPAKAASYRLMKNHEHNGSADPSRSI
jgi:hypothetical protein